MKEIIPFTIPREHLTDMRSHHLDPKETLFKVCEKNEQINMFSLSIMNSRQREKSVQNEFENDQLD